MVHLQLDEAENAGAKSAVVKPSSLPHGEEKRSAKARLIFPCARIRLKPSTVY